MFAYCKHQRLEVVKSWKWGYGSIHTLAQQMWLRAMTGVLLWFVCPQYLIPKWVPRSQNNNENWKFTFLPLEELCWSTLEGESSKDCPQSGAWRKGERQLHNVSYFVLWELYIVTIGHDSCLFLTRCTQVDLKCVDPASGGYYYPDHLPILGEILHCQNPWKCLVISSILQ